VNEDVKKALKAATPVVAFIVAGSPAAVLEKHGIDLAKAEELRGALKANDFGKAFAAVTPEMINAEIMKGAGFVSYAGHGNTNRIATFLPNDPDKRIPFEIADIEGMNNNEKLPIFYLDACLTGKLDYNILDKGILILYPFCLVKILLENIVHPKNFFPVLRGVL
jgi:hypothetical protein